MEVDNLNRVSKSIKIYWKPLVYKMKTIMLFTKMAILLGKITTDLIRRTTQDYIIILANFTPLGWFIFLE